MDSLRRDLRTARRLAALVSLARETAVVLPNTSTGGQLTRQQRPSPARSFRTPLRRPPGIQAPVSSVDHRLQTLSDPDALATKAARFVAERALASVADRGRFTVAVSGGSTPWAMLTELARAALPWESVEMFQVDERVVALGDPNRNLTHLRQCLARVPARLLPMPVDEPDLATAAQHYADQLPERFDLVHLGLGPDGHTASLVPGDPDLEIVDRLVTISEPYQGHRRMTLTYPALERADEILWLISGDEKRDALTRLLAGDTSIPAGRVQAEHSTILADAAASPG